VTPDDWRLILEGVVATIAVLGFLLGIANLAFTWWTYQPHVTVYMSWAFLVGRAGTGPVVLVGVRNTGRVPVTLSSVGLDLRSGETAVLTDPPPFAPPLPHTLEPGRAWDYHLDPGHLASIHRGPKGPVRGPFVNDEAGHHWSGKSKRSFLEDPAWGTGTP
jgi:hypothetical protein